MPRLTSNRGNKPDCMLRCTHCVFMHSLPAHMRSLRANVHTLPAHTCLVDQTSYRIPSAISCALLAFCRSTREPADGARVINVPLCTVDAALDIRVHRVRCLPPPAVSEQRAPVWCACERRIVRPMRVETGAACTMMTWVRSKPQ